MSGVASMRSDFEQFLTHPIKINHDTWSGSTLLSGVISKDIVRMYLTALPTTYAKKFASMWYFSAIIRIRIVVQGSAQSFGKMYYTFTPRVQNAMTQPAAGAIVGGQYHNCEIVPHLVVDPSKNATYEIDLPVCTPTGWYQLYNGVNPTHGSYQLERFMLNQILSGTAQAGTCNICMYMSLVNPRFEGLTLGLSSDFVAEKKASDYVQSVSNFSAQVVPFTGEFAPTVTLFSQVSGTLASVLRWFGFSKPPAAEHHVFVTNRNVDNYSQIEGTSTAMVLGCSQKQSLSIDPTLGASYLSDMAIAEICSKPSLVSSITITSATAAESSLTYTNRVSPMVCRVYSGTTSPKSFSPMGMIGALATFWCGDITFRLEFVCSVFTRATVLVAWDPYNYTTTPPTFADAVSVLKNETIQIVGNTAVDLTIPWKSYMPCLKTGSLSLPNAAGAESSDNGTLYFFIVNPVQDNGSTTPTLYMNVYMSSSNISFLAPTQDAPIDYTWNTEAYSNEFCPAAKVDFGPKTDLSKLSLRCTGDEVKSVKDIAMRMTIISGVATATVSGKPNITTSMPNAPMFASSLTATGVSHNTYFTLMALGYVGYRGSVRWSAKASTNWSSFNSSNHFYYGVGHATKVSYAGSVVSINDNKTGAQPLPTYAITHANEYVSERLDFTCPMIIPTDYYPTRVTVNNTNDGIDIYTTLPGGDSLLTPYVNVYQGCGDDGVFLWFVGFPTTTN